jgi:triosephosphate isomerase
MQKIIVGNLKMNLLTIAERDRYFESIKKEMRNKQFANTQIVLCPPAVHFESFVKKIKTKNISIGAQNIFWEERGSYTGEISASMVKNFGVEYVIVGHSERRKYFFETNEIANAKIKIALKNKLEVVYCVGESEDQRLTGQTMKVISDQMINGLVEIPASKMSLIKIAYEPVWSVGTDKIPEENSILEIKILIKKILTEKYGATIAEKVMLLYGGSVKAAFVQRVCIGPGMDGVLIGRESLIPSEFVKIIKIIDKN